VRAVSQVGFRLHRGFRRTLKPMASVELQAVSCIFKSGSPNQPEVRAVDQVDLRIKAGEFFTLLGPSGSGKTTCLRMIGGFALPTSGKVFIDGQEVTSLPPYARPVNTVFQDYALFPHMTVAQNIAYGLMVKGVPRDEREARAQKMLDMVALPDVGERRPMQLSGGQRQRVALARALINEPKVLLLDEPLGALDLKLREQMQTELKSLQRRLGITFLFITHDQHEALSMSDRIGVFNNGKLEQVGSPQELYDKPQTKFVAQFLGAANVLTGEAAQQLTGHEVAMLRPEKISIQTTGNGRATGKVVEVQYFGAYSRIKVELGVMQSQHITVDYAAPNHAEHFSVNQTAVLNWDEHAVHALRSSS
jgi:putative spermidine/putrescine transport system ATP-binding protein